MLTPQRYADGSHINIGFNDNKSGPVLSKLSVIMFEPETYNALNLATPSYFVNKK